MPDAFQHPPSAEVCPMACPVCAHRLSAALELEIDELHVAIVECKKHHQQTCVGERTQ
jgi:hypothetical protein